MPAQAAEFKDIIVLPMHDHYYNVTIKAMAIMTWGAEYCGAFYVMKTDDDVYIHMGRLLATLNRVFPNLVYAGRWSSVYYPRRQMTNKWGVTPERFPFAEGPGYNLGSGYVLSRDLALDVASKRHLRNYRRMDFEDQNTGMIVASQPYRRVDLPTSLQNNCTDDVIVLCPVSVDGTSCGAGDRLGMAEVRALIRSPHVCGLRCRRVDHPAMRFLYARDVPTRDVNKLDLVGAGRCKGYNEAFPATQGDPGAGGRNRPRDWTEPPTSAPPPPVSPYLRMQALEGVRVSPPKMTWKFTADQSPARQ